MSFPEKKDDQIVLDEDLIKDSTPSKNSISENKDKINKELFSVYNSEMIYSKIIQPTVKKNEGEKILNEIMKDLQKDPFEGNTILTVKNNRKKK